MERKLKFEKSTAQVLIKTILQIHEDRIESLKVEKQRFAFDSMGSDFDMTREAELQKVEEFKDAIQEARDYYFELREKLSDPAIVEEIVNFFNSKLSDQE